VSTSSQSPDRSGPVTSPTSGPESPSLADLQHRVESLEQDRERFMKALHGAVGMLLENPMASAMMPKEMKRDLRAYLEKNGNG